MKYIRTKNGVLFPTNAHEEDIPKDDCFFKVGDTIEELCDEFVCVLADGTHTKILKNGIISKIVKGDKKKGKNFAEIYGAIWTSKGLIYVAKMNEEGELELL